MDIVPVMIGRLRKDHVGGSPRFGHAYPESILSDPEDGAWAKRKAGSAKRSETRR